MALSRKQPWQGSEQPLARVGHHQQAAAHAIASCQQQRRKPDRWVPSGLSAADTATDCGGEADALPLRWTAAGLQAVPARRPLVAVLQGEHLFSMPAMLFRCSSTCLIAPSTQMQLMPARSSSATGPSAGTGSGTRSCGTTVRVGGTPSWRRAPATCGGSYGVARCGSWATPRAWTSSRPCSVLCTRAHIAARCSALLDACQLCQGLLTHYTANMQASTHVHFQRAGPERG